MAQSSFPLFRNAMLIIAALAIGAWAGNYWTSMHRDAQVPHTEDQHVDGHHLDSLTDATPGKPHSGRHMYVCPMHPEIVQDHEGTCPICGMDLVPAEAAVETEDRSIVTITPEVTNNLSVRVTPVSRRDISRSARLPAYIVGYQAGLSQGVRTNLAGKLKLKAGSRAHAGDVLFEIEVPGVKAIEEAHLDVLKSGDEKAIADSRMKLRESGMTGDDIKTLETERKIVTSFKYVAPMDGMVTGITHASGDMVRPGETILVLQSKGSTSVDVDIFQTEALWLRTGDKAELRVRQFPNQVWKSDVSLQGMKANPEKRTYGLSLVFPMEETTLSNDMFGEVVVTGASKHNVLVVPRDALISTEGHSRVIVALGDGRFKPVAVQPGTEDENYVEIISGLKEGDKVVVSSQFLLDSESSMRAEINRMTGEGSGDVPTEKAGGKPDNSADKGMSAMKIPQSPTGSMHAH